MESTYNSCPDCGMSFDTVTEMTDHITNVHKILTKLDSGANRLSHSLATNANHKSPLDDDMIHVGGDGIEVKVLAYPDKEVFDLLVYKAVVSTRGGVIKDVEPDPVVVDDAFKGGLNQCLEWLTVVFEINGISRGLTHELVRTRKASFAQQSLRHADMGEYPNMRMPQSVRNNEQALRLWLEAIHACREAYRKMVQLDIPYQDARTALPIGTETYVVAEYPLSEFLATYAYRSCYMFYPEIVYLFRLMRKELLEKCPWLSPYILTSCEKSHKCTYQGWEKIEGHCPMPWAFENNRTWKSRAFSY